MVERANNTRLCISIAENPGKFGMTVFNAAFSSNGDNIVYEARKVTPDKKHLEEILDEIRRTEIIGCGVSMPFKIMVLDLLDMIDPEAERIGAVNTIVNEGGKLIGYNTDYISALEILSKLLLPENRKVLMLGSGGVASAICGALKKLEYPFICITSRNNQNAQRLAQKWNFTWIPIEVFPNVSSDIFINATPIGMDPEPDKSPLSEPDMERFKTIVDVVNKPLETKLGKIALRMGKRFVPGSELSLGQAIKQYELYTKKPAPITVMRQAIQKLQ